MLLLYNMAALSLLTCPQPVAPTPPYLDIGGSVMQIRLASIAFACCIARSSANLDLPTLICSIFVVIFGFH